MNFVDLIIKKRDKLPLTESEINFFVKSVLDNTASDYQISAMLMAICINSLNDEETAALTMAMAKSGHVLDLSGIDGMKVDKHSTGGVADTTTLVLLPLVASCGLPVVKMSGRGLGHTGGTVDKLEAIPGFNVNLSTEQAIALTKKNNCVIMSQTSDIAPADKKLYALRDVTGTVESIPLIAASIMSKKIASGADAYVLDVKCGTGAFMKDMESARALARTMVDIGKNIGKKVIAVITDMNAPLGFSIGNSFEVIEAIEILKGNAAGRLKEVSLELGGYMLMLSGGFKDIDEAKGVLEENIRNGKGLIKFREIIRAQGGDINVIDDYSLFPRAASVMKLKAASGGYIYEMDTYSIGKASVEAGAGRVVKESVIDYGAGIILRKKMGDAVSCGDTIAEVYAENECKCNAAMEKMTQAVKISEKKPEIGNIILEVIQ